MPAIYEAIADQVFDAIASVYNPVPGVGNDPPYYVAAAGMTDERKFHKKSSNVGVTWIKKPHQAGTNVWMPGIYLYPMRRLRRTGSFEGLGNAYNRGPIPPDDPARIGRDVLDLFELIRRDFDGGPLPRRA